MSNTIARDKLDLFGTDSVCEQIATGKPMTAIARDCDVSIGALLSWIEAEPERSARVRDVRSVMARYWDEKAESCLETAPDEFELKRAKELSHHYRWRASKIAPRDYGEKVQQEITGANGGPFQTVTRIELVALGDNCTDSAAT